MKVRLIIAGSVVFALSLLALRYGGGLLDGGDAQIEQQVATTSPMKADHFSLPYDYYKNEVAANEKYGGKVLQLAIQSSSIETAGGGFEIEEDVGDAGTIRCYLPRTQRDQVAKIQRAPLSKVCAWEAMEAGRQES